jgi:hypothetical protein
VLAAQAYTKADEGRSPRPLLFLLLARIRVGESSMVNQAQGLKPLPSTSAVPFEPTRYHTVEAAESLSIHRIIAA